MVVLLFDIKRKRGSHQPNRSRQPKQPTPPKSQPITPITKITVQTARAPPASIAALARVPLAVRGGGKRQPPTPPPTSSTSFPILRILVQTAAANPNNHHPKNHSSDSAGTPCEHRCACSRPPRCAKGREAAATNAPPPTSSTSFPILRILVQTVTTLQTTSTRNWLLNAYRCIETISLGFVYSGT